MVAHKRIGWQLHNKEAMKLYHKIIGSLVILLCVVVYVPAQQLFTQMPRPALINLAALFTSTIIMVLLVWLSLHHRMNSQLNRLLTVSLRHMPDQSLTFSKHHTIPYKLKQLTDSFDLMSKEIENRETALLRSNEFSSTVLNNISDAVGVINPQTFTIIAVNPAFLKLYNVRLGEAIGKPCYTVTKGCPIGSDGYTTCPGKRALENGEFSKGQCVDKDGITFCDVRATPIMDKQGNVTKLLHVAHNISDEVRQREQIQYMAYHDGLTGLPNRTLFEDRLEQAILQSKRNSNNGVIAFIDLDKFKQINDTYGHAAGDEVLKTVAQRLKSCVRESDTVARMSGDEFLAIFHQVDNSNHATILAQQLLSSLRQPIALSTTEICISASVGMAFFPEQGSTIDELLKSADRAMYSAKSSGSNIIHLADAPDKSNRPSH